VQSNLAKNAFNIAKDNEELLSKHCNCSRNWDSRKSEADAREDIISSLLSLPMEKMTQKEYEDTLRGIVFRIFSLPITIIISVYAVGQIIFNLFKIDILFSYGLAGFLVLAVVYYFKKEISRLLK